MTPVQAERPHSGRERKSHSRGSGSRSKYENLERIDRIVNESMQKVTLNHETGEVGTQNVDIGLWKNMIFYKSIAHVQQQRKKQEYKVNHYANIPSKIAPYIRKPIESARSNKAKSRSKSKDLT